MSTPTSRRLETCDLSAIPDYGALQGVAHDAIDTYGGANQVYDAAGRSGLLELFEDISPDSYDAVRSTTEQLKQGYGALILEATGVESLPAQEAQLLSIMIACAYGEPTGTDKKSSQIAWPIQFVPSLEVMPTFSQTLGEATYHTDSQYSEKPEEYFGLFCVTPDKPGKGTNLLLRAVDIVDNLAKEEKHHLEALMEPYPFRVPSSYTPSGTDEDVQVVWAPIFNSSAGTIRYREDTIANALELDGVTISDEQAAGLIALKRAFSRLDPLAHHLESGEAIIIDNTRLLHARTTFDDPDRLLYRVRMRETV